MAKKNKEVEQEVIINQQPAAVEKELAFTKPDYAEMVKNSYKVIQSGKVKDRKMLVSLYGMYYNAFAGLIRSGILCSREVGNDGMPVIVTMLDSKNYPIRESVLLALFGEEAEYVVKPWKDSCAESSYFTGSLMKDFTNLRHQEGNQAGNEIVKLRARYDKQSAELQDLNEKYEQLLKDGGSGSDYSKKLAELEKKHKKELDNVKIHADRTITDLQKRLNQEKSEHDRYKRETAQELEDSRKYVYDPNYDHYYSDVLPKLVDSIAFSNTDIVIRGLCVGLSFAGILLSLVFVL